MAAMPGSLVPLVSMTNPQLGVSAHQQMLNSSLLVSSTISLKCDVNNNSLETFKDTKIWIEHRVLLVKTWPK